MPYYKLDAETKTPIAIDKPQWDAEVKNADPVLIAHTVGPLLVETFFTGFDHSAVRKADEPPRLWRTRVNGYHKDWPAQERYTSEADALAGHAKFVSELAKLPADKLEAGLVFP